MYEKVHANVGSTSRVYFSGIYLLNVSLGVLGIQYTCVVQISNLVKILYHEIKMLFYIVQHYSHLKTCQMMIKVSNCMTTRRGERHGKQQC